MVSEAKSLWTHLDTHTPISCRERCEFQVAEISEAHIRPETYKLPHQTRPPLSLFGTSRYPCPSVLNQSKTFHRVLEIIRTCTLATLATPLVWQGETVHRNSSRRLKMEPSHVSQCTWRRANLRFFGTGTSQNCANSGYMESVACKPVLRVKKQHSNGACVVLTILSPGARVPLFNTAFVHVQRI